MARKRYAKRRRSFRPWRRIKRSRPKIPLEVAVTGIALPFTPVADGWASPAQYASVGDYNGLGMGLVKAFTGYDLAGGGMNWLSVLNPFDFNSARYMKLLIAAGLVSKIRKRFVHIPFERVPIIGRMIS